MNKRQAMRIALAVEASYILFGAETGGLERMLSDKEYDKFKAAQEELAYSMLKRAGFDEPMNYDEIVQIVMGEDEPREVDIYEY